MTAVESEAAVRHAPVRWSTASEMMARSRLHLPQVTSHHLPRERLSRLLASSTEPLVLLSAPAGSGKTALAAEWAHRLDGARTVVWVSCHGGDADPWADVLHGMGRDGLPDPRPGAAAAAAGRHLGSSWVEDVVERVAGSRLPWTVFLDAYDVRTTQAGDELDRLLTYAGADLQVVLTTRADPVLPLHRYRLQGDVLEVRAADLAFTDAEAEALLRCGGVELGPDDLHALNSRLAGWAAGLRFALPVLAAHPDPEALVSSAAGFDGNVNAYLVEEVLDAQAPALRDLILTTSVPEALTPGLLEELTGEPAGRTTLRLMRANVFLESTPGGGSGLRYVPFFRDLVRAQLAAEAPERMRGLQRTVAAWYAARGRWDDAVTHLDRAGERPDWGALLVDGLLVGRLLCEGGGDSLRRLVTTAPRPSGAGPDEHLVAAAAALADGDDQGCSLHLDAARLAGVGEGRAAVTAAVLEAGLAETAPDPRYADEVAARAEVALSAQRSPGDRGADDTAAVLLLVRARSALRLGALERADQLLATALGGRTASWSAVYRSRCLALAALLHACTGAVPRAVVEADEALAAASLHPSAEALATAAHLGGACAAWAADDVAGARAHLAAAGTHPDPLWQVVRAVVAADLDRCVGAVQEAAAHLDAAAGAAELAGPWPADWVGRQRAAAPAARQQWRPAPPDPEGRVVAPLTPREVEVLAAMSAWLTTEEIADSLFVSVNTVRTHVRNILTKLGVNRRSAAIREAFRLGLLTSDPRVDAAPALVRST